jgi:GxxExxY protein
MTEIKHKEITDKILKAFYTVYNELGPGFLESVYEKAMILVLSESKLKIESQKQLSVFFRNTIIGEFKPDLIVNERVIVELKAVKTIIPEHEAQLINYLKVTKIEVGLLLNFGDKPEFKRIVYENKRKNRQ